MRAGGGAAAGRRRRRAAVTDGARRAGRGRPAPNADAGRDRARRCATPPGWRDGRGVPFSSAASGARRPSRQRRPGCSARPRCAAAARRRRRWRAAAEHRPPGACGCCCWRQRPHAATLDAPGTGRPGGAGRAGARCGPTPRRPSTTSPPGRTVKVISGDNPATVAAVGRALGPARRGQPSTPATCPRGPDVAGDALEKATVFGRVTPQQKRAMVAALQRAGTPWR